MGYRLRKRNAGRRRGIYSLAQGNGLGKERFGILQRKGFQTTCSFDVPFSGLLYLGFDCKLCILGISQESKGNVGFSAVNPDSVSVYFRTLQWIVF